MRHGKVFVWLACAATLGGCATDTPPDVAQLASAATLSDAIARASSAYGVPRSLLAAIAWSETRFGNPALRDDNDAERGVADAHTHGTGDVGSLGLRGATAGARATSVDTLGRAQALLGVGTRDALSRSVGLGVAGAAAVLAELGRQTGANPSDLASWAEAVARYSALPERGLQVSYAAQVFDVLRGGVAPVVTFTGEALGVAATPSLGAVESMLGGVGQTAQASSDYGPALWSAASSSNYTRGRGGSPVQYVVIHTMQGSYAGSISWFRNPAAMASAHYNIRSSDGQITQMVVEGDTAWHGGNWYFNQRSVGIEHEGYVADPGRWYTEAMYVASARLTRALCDKYRIPIDRAHIIGHYQIPRSGSGAPCAVTATNCGGAGGHTDPGNGGGAWNWNHFMDLVRGGSAPPPPPPPPPPQPPPPAPAYAAELVGVSCPATATAGERPVAYVEYRNTGTATWSIASTRVGTTNPRDHDGVFYDAANWVARNRPSGVDRATAPGAVGRFSFVLGIPDVATDRVVAENFGLVQEGATWFGPSDTAVRCAVMVRARTTASADAAVVPPADAATPDAPPAGAAVEGDAPAVEDAAIEDAPVDDAAVEDAGVEDAPGETRDGDLRTAPEGTPGCGCRTAPGVPASRPATSPFAALACAAALGLARRRARR